MGVFDRITELQEIDKIEHEAKFRYQNDIAFRIVVDYAVRASVPQFVKDSKNSALYVALEEQGIASAAMVLIIFERAFKEE